MEEQFGPESPEYQKGLFRVHRIGYACISGVSGAQSVLFARALDQLFVSSVRGDHVFLLYPGTYVVFGCMALSIGLQIYYLNLGLARFESLHNVPVFTSTWIVFTSLAGGVVYGEFEDFSVFQACMFPVGVVLCCVGVAQLSILD